MVDYLILIQLTLVHFISDFILQSDYVAINKSKDINVLLLHSFLYSLPFIVFLNPMLVVCMFTTHFCIDGWTSKLTSYLWQKEQRHYFFVVIGLDQWLHFLAILAALSIYPMGY